MNQLNRQCAFMFFIFAMLPAISSCGEAEESIMSIDDEIVVLTSEAQRLQGANAVKNLQRAFGYYLDKGYWDDAADLFSQNATFEYGIDGVYVGQQHIREYLVRQGGGNTGPGLPYGQYNRRMQLQPLVTVSEDGSSAQARWRELSMTGHFQQDAFWGDGIYENTYHKENGIWKIQTMHYFPNFMAPYKGGWGALNNAPKDWRTDVGKAFPADQAPTLVYQPYPEVFTPPYHFEHPVSGKSMSSQDLGSHESLSEYRLALARAQSVLAIENLQTAYGYYIDKGHWEEAATLFSDNGTYEWAQQGVYIGPARIQQALGLFGPENLEHSQLNNYMMLQPVINVSADNTSAKARWRSDVQLEKEGKSYWGEGTYENEYVNENGIWKLSSLHYYPTFQSDYDIGFLQGAVPMAEPNTELPPDLSPTEVYASLPSVYLPEYHYQHPGLEAPAQELTPLVGTDEETAELTQTLIKALSQLADEHAIQKVQRIYGYYVDKTLFTEVSQLFTEDASLEIGGRGVFLGKEHIYAYLNGLGGDGFQKPGELYNHQNLQGIVTVNSDGKTGKGRWAAFVMADSGDGGLWADVTYENEYTKVDGIWKISKLRAPFNMYTVYPEGWGVSAKTNTSPDSWLPMPDLRPSVIYLVYPNYYNEPFHYPNPVTGKVSPVPHPHAGGTASMQADFPLQ